MSLTAVLPQLLHDTDCVSFYEALAVAQEARRHDSLDASVLQHMVHLHDAVHTTDGARTILADFIRTYQARIQQERAVAARPVTLKDHGKMLRTTVGATLVLMLDERRAAGFEWNVTSCSGDPQLVRLPDPSESITRACFEITWSQRGHMFLTLREECADLSRTKGRSVQPRQFEIQIVVE